MNKALDFPFPGAPNNNKFCINPLFNSLRILSGIINDVNSLGRNCSVNNLLVTGIPFKYFYDENKE
jgi:hypothetical protein